MLEILFLVFLGKKIAGMARDRNRGPTPWVILLVVFWIGGEIAGAMVGGIAAMIADPNQAEPPLGPLLIGAVCGAILGASAAFGIVSLLPRAEPEYEDDDDRPRRRERDDDDYDDERPRRRRVRDDDEEEDYDRRRDRG